jgi:hypothetical protein
MRVIDGVAHLAHDPRALRRLERRADPPELEAVDVLHEQHRRRRVGAELEDLDDAAVLKERECARFLQKRGETGRDTRIRPDDLRGDESMERQVLELVDLADAARAEPFDHAKSRHGWRARDRRRVRNIETRHQLPVVIDQRAKLGQQLRPIGHQLLELSGGRRYTRGPMAVDVLRKPPIDLGEVRVFELTRDLVRHQL